MFKYVMMMLTLSGCGVRLTTDPIKVEHSIDINIVSVEEFCNNFCKGFTEEETFNTCKADCIIRVIGDIK